MRARSTVRPAWRIVAVVLGTAAMLPACGLDFRPYEPIVVDAGNTDAIDVRAQSDADDMAIDLVPIDDTSGCGFAPGACCPDGNCFVGACSAGVCVPCGAAGQLCCAGSVCNALLTCSITGNCGAPCGAAGQPCCDGTTCGAGAMCTAGMCVACGGEGQPCCSGGVCGTSFNCLRVLDPGGRCTPCGGPGEFCCSTGTACRGGGSCTSLVDVSICEVAGTRVLGGSCNPSTQNCPTNGVCDSSGTCFECGRYGEWCCDTAAGCVASPDFSCRQFPMAMTYFCY